MIKNILTVLTIFIFVAVKADKGERGSRNQEHQPKSAGMNHDDEADHDDHEGHDHGSKEKGHDANPEKEHAAEKHGRSHSEDEHKEKGHEEKHAEKDDDHSAHDHKEESGLISLTAEQLKTVKLKISKAEAGDLKTKIFLPGEIKYNRDRMAQVMPRMPGFVIKIFKNEGDYVKLGEALSELQSHKLGELYAEYQSALEMENKSKSEFEIKNRLRQRKAVSEMDYIKARQDYANARVSRHRAEDKLASLGLKPLNKDGHSHDKSEICTSYMMKSPISGTVITKKVTIGENYAEDNTKVPFVIADLSVLWLDLSARQSDLPKLRKGQPVTVKLGDGYQDIKGKISYIAPNFQLDTRTVLVRVMLNNKSGKLKPGHFATGVVSISGIGKNVVVSRSSVILLAGEKVVFVPEDHGFKAVPVTTGRSSNGFVEIVSGLHPGDKYVSNGAFELKAVMVTSGMDPHAGHGH